jgi:hypothetical protein
VKYYIIGFPDTSDCFVHCDDNGVPSVFETEAAAIEEAKVYAPAAVVKTVALVTETTRVKVTKVK